MIDAASRMPARRASQVPRSTVHGHTPCHPGFRVNAEHDAMPGDPFALFDAWFAEARAERAERRQRDGARHGDADGRPSVRMVLLKGHGRATASCSTPMPRAARARRSPPIRARRCCSTGRGCAGRCASKGPLERWRGEADAYFATRVAQFAARRRVGPVAPARRPQDLPRRVDALRAAYRRQGRAAPAALDRLPPRARTDRVLARPPPPPARAPPVRPRRRRLDRRLLYP